MNVSQDAAHYLADGHVRTVGVDHLLVGGYTADDLETHQALLTAGEWIIEGPNLSQVRSEIYDMTCPPPRIRGADGAPARAI